MDHVRRFYECVNRTDMEGALGCLHPEVEWVVPVETSLEPRVFHGHEGARSDFEQFLSTWSELGVELLDAREHGDGAVVVDVRWFGISALSRVPVDMRLGGLWEVRDGLVTRFEHFPSADDARAVLSRPG